MRRSFTTLTLVSVCGLLALAAVGALGAMLIHRARSAEHAHAGTRSWPVTLSPAPDDFALAQVSFHVPRRVSRTAAGTLRVSVDGPFGADYLAGAVARASAPGSSSLAAPGVLRLLVLVVNRPSELLDPTVVHLSVRAPRSLGSAVVRAVADPFARGASAPRPVLCDLPAHGVAIDGAQLSAVTARGSALGSFDAAGAVAQAYDAACGLPYETAFKRAIEPSPPVTPAPGPAPPAPEPPAPPVGKLPGEGCKPAPGYACPG